MSLQDDYYDLESALEDEQWEAFMRIWEAFVELESEVESLRELQSCFRKMIRITLPQ